jgi:hypothetical protein
MNNKTANKGVDVKDAETQFTRYRHGILPAENHHGFNCSHDTGRLYSALTICCTNQLNRQNKISNNNFCSFVHFILHNRNEILTVRRSHGTLTVEFRSVFKLLRFTLRFHIFSYRHCVNATPKSKNFVSFSNSAGIV